MRTRPRRPARRPRTRRTTAVLAAALALSAGCAAGPDTAAPAAPRTIKPVRGCGASSWTDPADLSPGRAPARCARGAPAPVPLTGHRTLTIATGTLTAEYTAPLRVALAKGEFRKEGLDVRLKVLPTPDALPLLARGELDALWAAPEAAVVNGVHGGFDIRWVAGNFSPAPGSRSGLWVRIENGERASAVSLKGTTLGTMIGKGSVIMYPMARAFAAHGAALDAVTFRQLGPADVLTALTGGGVDSAWLLDPVWRQVDGSARYAFLGGQPQGEPLGGALYGPNLLTKDPDAGVALLRAYVRTVNTYFAGDYKADKAFTGELARLLGVDRAVLEAVPALRMDWEIRKGTTDRLQRAYRDAGVVKGDPLPENRLVDRRLYAEAVGHRM
ncbi:ABC transporter substrate-binding protein [Streptomyces sp. RS10V-4]|uniref:ABC transporter substrate-binding protein n=1 Tax=Streptomyces rhizoryzae TaxID=2932493 RepID=UPI002006C418|nr:ABC transporter substrate-binding protein [Streptomyces rhizoryzae]MCK7624062.1 ABC transporter substrate-binding protein [Streptomyces rhizoryzae]